MSYLEWILQRLSFSVIREVVFLKQTSLYALAPASPQSSSLMLTVNPDGR